MGIEFTNPFDEDDVEGWLLFPNQNKGTGYSRTDRGFLTNSGYLYPEGYDRAINFTSSADGTRITPSFEFNLSQVVTEASFGFHPSFIKAWQTSAYIPTALIGTGPDVTGAGSFVYKLQDGALSLESTSAGGAFGSATFHDDGSGTPYLYAGRYTTTTGVPTFLSRRTQAGVWTQDADVAAKFVLSVNGDLWRSTNDYTVSKCPAGSEPFTIGSWGGGFQVGTADSKITAFAQVGGALYVLKENAIYAFSEAANDGDGAFIEIYTAAQFHPFNFNFATPDGAGGFFTATQNGDIINVQQFGAIVVSNPFKDAAPGRDTGMGRIDDLAVNGADIYALVAPYHKLTKNVGLYIAVTLDNFGTFSNKTANLTDDSMTTTADLSISNVGANDSIIIGADVPFLAVQLLRTTINSLTITDAPTVSYSTGAGTWTAVSVFDGTTDITTTFGSLGCSGTIAAIASGVDTMLAGWVKATYNSQSKYWWKIQYASAGPTSGAVYADCSVLPARAAPTFTTPSSGVNVSRSEASGEVTKILKGKRSGDEFVWDDYLTLPSTQTVERLQFRPPGGNKLAVITNPTTNSPDASLLYASRDRVLQIALPSINDPSLVPYPKVQRDATNQVPPIFYPSAIQTNGPREFVGLSVYGVDMVEQVDTLRAAVRPDDYHPWFTFDDIPENRAVFTGGGQRMRGRRWSVAVQLIDANATDERAPGIEGIVLWLRKAKHHEQAQLQPIPTIPAQA